MAQDEVMSEAPPDKIPLDAPQRVQPIHDSLPNIKLPAATSDAPDPVTLHPVTLRPLTHSDLKAANFDALRAQYDTPEAAAKAREDAVREVKKIMDENERKVRDIEREMDEKEKTRDIERKVYLKKFGKDGV